MADGQLKPIVDPTPFHGLEAVAAAVEYLHAGKNLGKPVVRLCSAAEEAEAKAQRAAVVKPPAAVDVSSPHEAAAAGVGSMERVREIQSDCFADDVAVGEHMTAWSEERLTEYFENGGA